MKAVILCGGQGTRIRDANELLPKPMLPIGGKPIVWHIMKMYAHHGVREFVLCLGYRGWALKEFFLNYKAMTSDLTVTLGRHGAVEVLGKHDEEDWKVTLAETGEETQTGGRVAAVRRYVEGDEPFLLTYGDGVSDVDVGATIAAHRSHGKVATVTAVRPPGGGGGDGHQVFQGALPACHSSLRSWYSRSVSMGCQKPSWGYAPSWPSFARFSSGACSQMSASPRRYRKTSGWSTKKPPLIQPPSPAGFSAKPVTRSPSRPTRATPVGRPSVKARAWTWHDPQAWAPLSESRTS